MSTTDETSGRDRANMVNDVSAKVLTQYKRNKMKLLVSVFCVNVVVFGVLTYFVLDGRKGLEDAYNRDLVVQEEAGNIALFDEILTMSCRMAAWSGDESWEERYLGYVDPIENSISRVIDMVPAIAENFVTTTQSANDALIALETDVLDTYRTNMTAAQDIIEGDEYATQKEILLDGLEVLYAEIQAEARWNRERQEERGDAAIVCLSAFAALYLGVGVFMFWSAKFHSQSEEQRLFKSMVRMFNENKRKRRATSGGGSSSHTMSSNRYHSGTRHGSTHDKYGTRNDSATDTHSGGGSNTAVATRGTGGSTVYVAQAAPDPVN